MTAENSRLPEGAIDALVAQARGDARKLAALASAALEHGSSDRAYALAREARALAPHDPEVRSLAQGPLSAAVPPWHFRIVRDESRNDAYDAALRRAVGPDTRVLDIGAGTGLLAMMAARAGADAVVSCEMNPAIADAATEIVALNGYADRVRVIPKRSTELEPEADLGGPADLLVSEIVSNDMLSQGVLPVMEDSVRRLLKPGGTMIPLAGRVRVALAHWSGMEARRPGQAAGFDISPFDCLDRVPQRVKAGDPRLALRSAAVDLFDFDFTSGGPYPAERRSVTLAAEGGEVNGVIQWIQLQLDEETTYENRPESGARSCWACLFYPIEPTVAATAGETVLVHGAHNRLSLRIWAGPGGPESSQE